MPGPDDLNNINNINKEAEGYDEDEFNNSNIMEDGDEIGVRLGRRLQRIAAIDEEAGLVRADQGQAGGTGKAGDPGQARFAGGDRLAAMGIGAGNQKPLNTGCGHRFAQGLEAGRDIGLVGLFLEALEDGGRKALGGHREIPVAGLRSGHICAAETGMANRRPLAHLLIE